MVCASEILLFTVKTRMTMRRNPVILPLVHTNHKMSSIRTKQNQQAGGCRRETRGCRRETQGQQQPKAERSVQGIPLAMHPRCVRMRRYAGRQYCYGLQNLIFTSFRRHKVDTPYFVLLFFCREMYWSYSTMCQSLLYCLS